MSTWTYYNEIDPYCVRWLRNLMRHGLIAKGPVDDRPIQEVDADDTKGYSRCHFFAGIAGWDIALQLARWPEYLPIWTGSCPCQPFSVAGKRKGLTDERHLWPFWLPLIRERLPPRIAGEQVASKDGRGWLAGVRADLEELGYEVGAADLCAAGTGAPHIRQRLWWVAEPKEQRSSAQYSRMYGDPGEVEPHGPPASGLANGVGAGLEGRQVEPAREERAPAERGGVSGRLGDTEHDGPSTIWKSGEPKEERWVLQSERPSFWGDFDLVHCLDGKARRIEPGTFPLAHGVPSRVAKLRAIGNAIVPQVAAEVLKAWLECRP